MEILMSNWPSIAVQSVPQSYIFPPDKRPGKHVFPVCKNVPLIDLEKGGREEIVQQILEASQGLGFFQVIHHGVPLTLMSDAMAVFKDFFATPPDYKATFYSTDPANKCRIYSSTMNYDNEQFHYWRDNFTHHCHPLADHISLWPDNPDRYRQVIGEYSVHVRKLLLRILELVRQGLGLQPAGYFDGGLSQLQLLSVNHHVPCPDPTVTLGMPEHSDPNLITVLHQGDVPGLQVFHEGEWMDVEPRADAFLVIPGLQLKVISNGKVSSPIHRVRTDAKEGRTTIGTFLIPSENTVIEAGDDDEDCRPWVYRSFTYKEFYTTFVQSGCHADVALRCFQIKKPK